MKQPSSNAVAPAGRMVLFEDLADGHPQPSTVSTRFMLEPVPPFRLDLTAWALRRRPANIVDRWDGGAYRRAVKVDGTRSKCARPDHRTRPGSTCR